MNYLRRRILISPTTARPPANKLIASGSGATTGVPNVWVKDVMLPTAFPE